MTPSIRACRNYLCSGLILIVTAIIHGCILHPIIGPGYLVLLEVRDEAFEEKDLEVYENLAEVENFKKTQSHRDDGWFGIYYHRDLEESQSEEHRYKFIRIIFSYEYEEKVLSVHVMNDWTGQQEAIKKEINHLADQYIEVLESRYGEGSVKVRRIRTGPPF